ncbi:MAG: hypothetical protein ACE5PV_05205 [Candidatus Poribacteria bacterium]
MRLKGEWNGREFESGARLSENLLSGSLGHTLRCSGGWAGSERWKNRSIGEQKNGEAQD